MPQYTRPLGDAVKRARGELGVTQRQVAEAADVDVRTVLNIENYKGNPKLEVLYPLIRGRCFILNFCGTALAFADCDSW